MWVPILITRQYIHIEVARPWPGEYDIRTCCYTALFELDCIRLTTTHVLWDILAVLNKCVARNDHIDLIWNRFIWVSESIKSITTDIFATADHPDRPGRPHVTKVSDREVYMIWEEPETDGHSYILAYRVDWHKPGDERWTTAIYCIDECALVKVRKKKKKKTLAADSI